MEIDAGFAQDVVKSIESIKGHKSIEPLERKLLQVGESVIQVLVFHDASISTIGVIIYLMVEDEKQEQKSEDC